MRPGIIVPALVRDDEELANLRRCLLALLEHTSEVPIVLVDDGSPLDLCGLVEALPARVDLLRQENQGPAAARNAGASSLCSRDPSIDTYVFIDADIVVPSDLLARLEQGLMQADAVWGTVLAAHPHPELTSRYKNLCHRAFTRSLPDHPRHLTSMMLAIRRAPFDAVGGFPTSFRTVSVEDVELGRSLHEEGFRILLDKGLEGEHWHRFTLARALKNDFHKVRALSRVTLGRLGGGGSSVRLDGPGERSQLRYLLGVPLGLGVWVGLASLRPGLTILSLGLLALHERELLGSLARSEGRTFALACLPLMVLERGTVALALGCGAWDLMVSRVASGADRT